MNGKVGMQLSVSTGTSTSQNPLFDGYHQGIYRTPTWPIVTQTQHATIGDNDALKFTTLVYGSATLIETLVFVFAVVGVVMLLVGVGVLVRLWVLEKRELVDIKVEVNGITAVYDGGNNSNKRDDKDHNSHHNHLVRRKDDYYYYYYYLC